MLYQVLFVVSLFINSEAYRRAQANVDPFVVYPSLIGKNAIKPAPRQMPHDIQGEWEKDVEQPSPQITKVHVRADVQYRYARTVVETSIKNPSTSKAQEVVFNMVLPDAAFTSNFTIKLAGDETLYIADVTKKEDAQDAYNAAVKEGQTVGLVKKDTRDANRLSIRYVVVENIC